MFKFFLTSFSLSFAENANVAIYSLKKMPLLGKRLPDSLYRQKTAKLILGIIRYVFGIVKEFFKKFIYFFIMIILPAIFIIGDKGKIIPAFFHIAFFLNFILGSFMISLIFNKSNWNGYSMIKLMGADSRKYYVTTIVYYNLKKIVYFIIPAILLGSLGGVSPAKCLLMLAELAAFRIAAEAFQLFIYEKTKVILIWNRFFNIILYPLALLLAYGLLAKGIIIDFRVYLLSIYGAVGFLILGASAYTYIYRYKGYSLISEAFLTRDNVIGGALSGSDLYFANVKLDEGAMDKENEKNSNLSHKEGYEYLNSLFFLRHRKIVETSVKSRVIVIGIIFLILLLVTMFVHGDKKNIVNAIQGSAPFFILLMYWLSTGATITKAMFYNCDASLLRYGFYRERKVILSNFTIRLKRVILFDLISAAAICIGLFLLIVLNGFASRFMEFLPLFLSIICLACFFSIHHLFVYYVMQPYTAERTIEGPLFIIINITMYLIVYICSRIRTSSIYFAIGIIIITVAYMFTALAIIYKVAPKTFRLK